MKKIFTFLLMCAFLGGGIHAYASQYPQNENEQVDTKKDNKKKDKKKKEKKKKEQKSVQEVIAELKNIEWTKPAPSGDPTYDKMFESADQFITKLKNVDNEITLYSIGIVASASGDSILAAIDSQGNIKSKKEATAQTLAAVGYAADMTLNSTDLALMVANCAIQIGQDAIPFVGNADRKKANVQIAKATKGFKLLTELIGTQRKIMDKYVATNSDLKSGDVDVEALQEMNVDVENVINLSDDEFNALWDQENAE